MRRPNWLGRGGNTLEVDGNRGQVKSYLEGGLGGKIPRSQALVNLRRKDLKKFH